MQIISMHWTDMILKSAAKPVNAPLIKEHTGINNYKARADQIKTLMTHITRDNYNDMCLRIKNLNTTDTIIGSSNFGKFIDLFENDNTDWIESINKKIEQDV